MATEETTAADIVARMVERHPDWEGLTLALGIFSAGQQARGGYKEAVIAAAGGGGGEPGGGVPAEAG